MSASEKNKLTKNEELRDYALVRALTFSESRFVEPKRLLEVAKQFERYLRTGEIGTAPAAVASIDKARERAK